MLGESLTAFSASKLVHGGDGAIELAGEFVEARRLGRIMRQEDAGETLALLKRAVFLAVNRSNTERPASPCRSSRPGERRTANTSGWLKAQTSDHGIAWVNRPHTYKA